MAFAIMVLLIVIRSLLGVFYFEFLQLQRTRLGDGKEKNNEREVGEKVNRRGGRGKMEKKMDRERRQQQHS